MPYRAAIVGCGKMGSTFADDPARSGIYAHAEAYRLCPDTELVAVCDTDLEKLQQCGERWQVRARYLTFEALLAEERPEVVSICTPDDTHHELAMAALQSKAIRALFIEKPLALDLAEAREIVRTAHGRGICLAVNYIRRYAASHLYLRDYLKSGWVGKLQGIEGLYTKGVLHNGTHWFDLIRFLFGEVISVRGTDVLMEKGSDPTLDACLELATGATAHLRGCDGGSFSVFEMDAIGTTGRIRIVESGHVIETYRVVDNPYYSGYRSLARVDGIDGVKGGLGAVTLQAVTDLVQCLESGRQPRCSGEDSLAALEIALAVRESALKGITVGITSFAGST